MEAADENDKAEIEAITGKAFSHKTSDGVADDVSTINLDDYTKSMKGNTSIKRSANLALCNYSMLAECAALVQITLSNFTAPIFKYRIIAVSQGIALFYHVQSLI